MRCVYLSRWQRGVCAVCISEPTADRFSCVEECSVCSMYSVVCAVCIV